MKTSAAGRKFIEGWEGLILQSYDDADDHIVGPNDHVHGTLTIGYGHTDEAGPPHVYKGMIITKEQADAFLASDLRSVENNVDYLTAGKKLNQNQYDALVSFDYNTGGLHRSSVLRDIENNRFDRVPADLMLWVRAGGLVVRGLVRRRAAEGRLFSQEA